MRSSPALSQPNTKDSFDPASRFTPTRNKRFSSHNKASFQDYINLQVENPSVDTATIRTRQLMMKIDGNMGRMEKMM